MQLTAEPPETYAGAITSQIPADTLRRLSVLNPFITLSHILLEWVLILGSITLCWRWGNLWAYVPCIIWIGGRQHALGVLMHEGSHYRIFRNKAVNEWVSDVLLAWPIFITTATYRANHWEHHRYTNTEKDPDCLRKLFQMDRTDWEFPITWRRLVLMFLKDLTAISAFTMIRILASVSARHAGAGSKSNSPVPGWARLAFYLIVITAASVFGFWKPLLLFWIVPYLTTFNLFLHIRSIAEHFATENENALNMTRTTIAPWWEKLFFPKKHQLSHRTSLIPGRPVLPATGVASNTHGAAMHCLRAQAHVTPELFRRVARVR